MRTNAGTDFVCDAQGKRGAQPAAADYMAVTANSTAPAAGDTALTGELGGGLARKQATYAHTTGTASYTMTATFTAGAGDVPVTINKVGLLNASSLGTLVYESAITAASLAAANDNVTITYTITP